MEKERTGESERRREKGASPGVGGNLRSRCRFLLLLPLIANQSPVVRGADMGLLLPLALLASLKFAINSSTPIEAHHHLLQQPGVLAARPRDNYVIRGE